MGLAVVKSGILVFVLLLLVFFPAVSRAASEYVLPYPSAMPGSKLYLLHKLEEKFTKYWYFGDYGKFNYNRILADRYLVEAKTLFEYKQYALALRSLNISNQYFEEAGKSVLGAVPNKPGRKEKMLLGMQQAEKHREVLEELKARMPVNYLWREEKTEARLLQISTDLDHAIILRKEQF